MTSPTAPRPKVRPLDLPYGAKLSVVPGLGTFALQGVGNTRFSTATFVHFRREGAPERERGVMRWRIAVDDDGRVEWRLAGRDAAGPQLRGRIDGPAETSFDPEVVEAALRLLDAMPARDPVGYAFQLHSAAEMEVLEHDRRVKEEKDRIAAVSGALHSPKAQDARPDELQRRIDRAHRTLADLALSDARVAALRGLVRAIDGWCRTGGGRTPIADVVGLALDDGFPLRNAPSVGSIASTTATPTP